MTIPEFVLYGLSNPRFDVFLIWDEKDEAHRIYREIDDQFLDIGQSGILLVKKSNKVEHGTLICTGVRGTEQDLFGRKVCFMGKFSFQSKN